MTQHTHKFELKRPQGTVRICACGKWKHSEHAGPAIVEQTATAKKGTKP